MSDTESLMSDKTKPLGRPRTGDSLRFRLAKKYNVL